MDLPKGMLAVMAGIVATGAILKIAGDGVLGSMPQKLAQYVTKGYGV